LLSARSYVGMDLYLYSFLTLTLGGSEWLTSRPGRFTMGKEHPLLTE